MYYLGCNIVHSTHLIFLIQTVKMVDAKPPSQYTRDKMMHSAPRWTDDARALVLVLFCRCGCCSKDEITAKMRLLEPTARGPKLPKSRSFQVPDLQSVRLWAGGVPSPLKRSSGVGLSHAANSRPTQPNNSP